MGGCGTQALYSEVSSVRRIPDSFSQKRLPRDPPFTRMNKNMHPFLYPKVIQRLFRFIFNWSGTDVTSALHTDEQFVAHTTAKVQSGCYASSETQGQVGGLEGSHNG